MSPAFTNPRKTSAVTQQSSPTVNPSVVGLQGTLIILDTETTGLDHKTEKLIEIAAVKMVDGEVTETYSSLINPQKAIRHSSFKIHGITDEMVADAPPIDVVLPGFMEFVGDHTFVAHNALFDYSFINEACKTVYDKKFSNHRIDTFEMYRSVFPDETSHGLSSLLAKFNFDSDVKHRALDDAQCLAKVYPKLRQLYEQKFAWQLTQLANIDYLVERYQRIQKAMQLMQAEMSDLKDIFKLHFQNGGRGVETTSGELMISSYRRNYSYDEAKVWQLALEGGFQERVFKLNPRAVDKAIDGQSMPAEYKSALIETRLSMNESRQITFIKKQVAAEVDPADLEEATPETAPEG